MFVDSSLSTLHFTLLGMSDAFDSQVIDSHDPVEHGHCL